MTRLRDLTGEPFERLTVLSRADDERNGASRWHCQCACGRMVTVRGANLTSGAVVSCGCRRAEIQRERAATRNRIRAKAMIAKREAATADCCSCLRRRVLQRCGEEWLCRWCANARAILGLAPPPRNT